MGLKSLLGKIVLIQDRARWMKLTRSHNPYQSFNDWFWGRFRCPKCGGVQQWGLMNDGTLVDRWGTKLQEKWIRCIFCDYEELVWKRDNMKQCCICKQEIKRNPIMMSLDGYYAHKSCWKKWGRGE